MMENDPLNTVELEFDNQEVQKLLGITKKRNISTKIVHKIGTEEMEIAVRDNIISNKNEIFLINPYQNFDDLDQMQQFYVEESLKAVSLCEEAQNNVDESTVYPIVIDNRNN